MKKLVPTKWCCWNCNNMEITQCFRENFGIALMKITQIKKRWKFPALFAIKSFTPLYAACSLAFFAFAACGIKFQKWYHTVPFPKNYSFFPNHPKAAPNAAPPKSPPICPALSILAITPPAARPNNINMAIKCQLIPSMLRRVTRV